MNKNHSFAFFSLSLFSFIGKQTTVARYSHNNRQIWLLLFFCALPCNVTLQIFFSILSVREIVEYSSNTEAASDNRWREKKKQRFMVTLSQFKYRTSCSGLCAEIIVALRNIIKSCNWTRISVILHNGSWFWLVLHVEYVPMFVCAP